MQIDWERTFDALVLIIVLAFLVERALAVLFENRIYIEYFDRDGLKELIALTVSIGICVYWRFDAISMIVQHPETVMPGNFITGAVIAGGSKASIKLFHDLLNIRSKAFEMRREIQSERAAGLAEKSRDKAKNAKNLATADRAADASNREADRARACANLSGSRVAQHAAERAAIAAAEARSAADKLRAE